MCNSINPRHIPPYAHGIALTPREVEQLEAALDAPATVNHALLGMLRASAFCTDERTQVVRAYCPNSLDTDPTD